MDFQEFEASLSRKDPPEGLTRVLQALWYEAKGDWARAHQIVQELPSAPAAWVHAYLHRKEGDTGNASYWYSRADRQRSSLSPQTEWQTIVTELLSHETE